MRRLLVLVHRVSGLTIAGFLVVAGLTGSLLVWREEIDGMINPDWLWAPPPVAGQPRLPPLVLRDAVLARHPDARVDYLPLHERPGAAATFWLTPRDGARLAVDTVFIDPYSGRTLGARQSGAISEGIHNLVPFLDAVHRSLALGKAGAVLLGVVALIWTVDCFVGVVLSFPAPIRKSVPSWRVEWLRRWRPAWAVRWQAGRYKRFHDLHRAGGLWPWGLLFVFAWSSVAFNLPEVYVPAMDALFTRQPEPRSLAPRLPVARSEPETGWADALLRARQLMREEGAREGFRVIEESSLRYDPQRGVFHYRVRSDLDVNTLRGNTALVFRADDGRRLGAYLPTTQAAGDTLTTWLLTLHLGHFGGLPYRIVVTLIGLLTAMLSITGGYLWWRKRASRRRGRSTAG